MATQNLNAPRLETAQAFKEVTINKAIDMIEATVAGEFDLTITGGTTTLLGTQASPEAQHAFFKVSGTLTSAATIQFPVAAGTGRPRIFAVQNNTSGSFTLTLKTVGGTGVTLTQSKYCLFLYNGSNIIKIGAEV